MARVANIEFNLAQYRKTEGHKISASASDAAVLAAMMFEMAGMLVKFASGAPAPKLDEMNMNTSGTIWKCDEFSNQFTVAALETDGNRTNIMDIFEERVVAPKPDEIKPIEPESNPLTGHKLF